MNVGKRRLLILVVAYNAERTISQVLARVPVALLDEYHVEVLVLDDSSQDRTFQAGREVQRAGTLPFTLHVLYHPVNQGYGGNQKVGYHFAIERQFDFVALLHGDGQYAPECLPDLVRPLKEGEADAVFGSRMLEKGRARGGGMPLYKFVGNHILTAFQNRMLRTGLSEFHSGYRVYSVAALARIPFALNTNDFHFDTEMIIQLVLARMRIRELPIPTYYGDEICRVNGLKYAWDVTRAVMVARAQGMGLFYDRRFDCAPAAEGPAPYQLKTGYLSPHSAALDAIPHGARVLDLGCTGGYVSALLKRERGCHVTAVDSVPLPAGVDVDRFVLYDLNDGVPPSIELRDFDYVLLLDVIEHLVSPERFVEQLRDASKMAPATTLLVSTANIAFIVNRLMLLFGQFTYGRRGILDLTHTRLFTFESFRRLFTQAGFRVVSRRAIPAPFALAFGQNGISRFLDRACGVLVRLAPHLFAYQMFFAVEPLPSLEYLLDQAHRTAATRDAAAPRHVAS